MGLLRPIPLQQVHKRAQLQPRDVGPAAALLHGAEQVEQLAAVGWQAAAKGAVLQVAVQVLQLTQQSQQGLGLALQLFAKLAQVGEHGFEPLLLLRAEPGLAHRGG